VIRLTDEQLVLIHVEELLRDAERENTIRMVTAGQPNRLMDYLDSITTWLRNGTGETEHEGILFRIRQ
jgi:hypothetical protein